MRVAIITDTHFGIKNDSSIFYDYFDKFLDNVFFPTLRKNKITKIIHGGDVFDRRKYINFNTLTWARTSFFDKIKENGISLDIIIGNHDTYFKNTNDINSPNLLLSDYDNIRIFDDVYEEDSLIYVPWITEDKKSDTLLKIARSSMKTLIGHLEVKGYTMFKGAICDHGLSSDIFYNYETVLSGHFHTKNNSSNIYYLGCPWDLTFSDVEDIKGFHIYDTVDYSLEFIQNPYKLFHKIYYNDSSAKKVSDVLYSKKKYEEFEKTYLKVVVESKVNPVFFDRYCDRLVESNPQSVIYAEQYYDPDNSEEDNLSLSEDTLSLIKGSIKDYSDLIPDEEKASELEKLLTNLYLEALKS
jgi:DNA repair exonuclease SbcCD nuclease subunit